MGMETKIYDRYDSEGCLVIVTRVAHEDGETYTVQSGEHHCSGLTIEEARAELRVGFNLIPTF